MTVYYPDCSNNQWSSNQEAINFLELLVPQGFSAMCHKVSEGNYYQDPYWPVVRDWCAANNLPCIGYHYVTTNDPASQAQTWLANGGGSQVMLDFEANSGDIANFWAVVQAFNNAGVHVALSYIPHWYWQQIGSPDLTNVPGLVSSAYEYQGNYASTEYVESGGDNGEGWTAYGGANPVVWQFTDSAEIGSFSVDCNAFRGTADQLAALFSGSGAPAPSAPSAKHVLLTVSGTGTNMWDTSSPQPAMVGSQLAAAQPDRYFWQPVGDYPAATFPMGPSVTAGVQSLIYLTTGETYPGFNITPGTTYGDNSLILLGYSQGAMVVCQFIQWCYQFNRTDILQRIVAVAVWGNPQRLEGYASGNEFAGWPMPGQIDGSDTGGIAQGTNSNGPVNMTAEQMQPHLPNPVTHFWGDFVNTNDADKGATELYANCPQNGVGSVEQTIFNAVQNLDLTTALSVVANLAHPMNTVDAILNGFEFLAATGNADHYTYDTTPIYNFVALAGSQTEPFGAA
ncbi:GH25 family lysozyme [Mycobacterium sp. pUA109]|uniref:GH25 family lysozyme n=1 Tax=Mycobacterium sp. pUA109 TaxID=3238982 RepID=UPI00351B33C4